MKAYTPTARPWMTKSSDKDGNMVICEPSGYLIAALPSAPAIEKEVANARLIVRAVNNHDALVAALNKAERLLTFLDGSGNNDPTPDRGHVSEVRRECLAALAAAG